MCDVASSDDPYPLFQDTVDNTDERIGLRADRRPRPDITRWHRIAQHLPDRARVDPKTTRRFALAQTLNHYRVVRPPIQFHSLHPPPFAPKCKGLSLTEFCSGATRLSGRFSEGLLLRRSHSRRHSSAILSSPRSPSSTILIFSSAEYCLRVAPLNILDNLFRRRAPCSGFLSHLHSLVVTTSPKPSLIKSCYLVP